MNFNVIFSGKFWLSSIALTCFSLFSFGILFISTTSAEIDPDTVVGVWLFDEGKGDVATDASGNGLDGEFNGKPKWVEGKFGEALEFDGKSAYVQVPAHENPNDAITVSAWAKSPTATWNQPGWMVEKRPAYIIIDAEEASALDLAKNPIDPDSGPVNIGFDDCCGGTRFGAGTVDEVVILSVALEQEDIEKMYKNGLYAEVLAVDPTDKMTTTWADVKVKY